MKRRSLAALDPKFWLALQSFSRAAFVWTFVLLVPAEAASDPIRIAVAPFAGGVQAERVAEAIVGELRQHTLDPLDRLITPGDFVAEPRLEPSAEKIRRWAYNAAVETVVVGRLIASNGAVEGSDGEHRIEIVLRSGHSGAELSRHDTVIANLEQIQDAGGRLAAAILSDLGSSDSGSGEGVSQVSQHRVGFGPRSAWAPRSDGGSAPRGQGNRRGLDSALVLAGFDYDAPIEIKADQAEIVNRKYGRELIFQRNVVVRQANVTLRSDHLKATYRKGESEPERLVARGRVNIDQGHRRARCDRAIYLRDAQQLTCTGHAELFQGCDIVRGKSIQFDLARDRARVDGAASIVILANGDAQATCGKARGVM